MDRQFYFLELHAIVATLRSPQGCPWDRAQTHHTLRQYMIEEACEAAEAMDGDDGMKIADELETITEKVILWFRENAYAKDRLGAAIDRVGVEAFEKALEGDDLLNRKEAILAMEIKTR